MKCLLCSFKSKNKKKLLDHCLSYCNIDPKNCFFQKLFQSDNKAFFKNCLRCNQSLATRKEKAILDSLKHYSDGKNIPFEEKLLNIIRYPSLTIYQVEYKKYSNLCPFYNSGKCLEEFSQNVKQRFHAASKRWFKCSFTIENTQNSIRTDLQPLLYTRYWSTETYDSIYFNDFIFHALKYDILKRVINNQMSGSYWYFKPFFTFSSKDFRW